MAAQWRFIASLRSIRDSSVLLLLHSPKRTPSLCMASNVSKSPSFQHDSHSSAHRIACLRVNMCLPTSFHVATKSRHGTWQSEQCATREMSRVQVSNVCCVSYLPGLDRQTWCAADWRCADISAAVPI